ncbi:hypothetical protein TUM20985_57320 [Mycobacterium antarcticum]|uniref:Asp23/Gls24 family envelope stress response protein n=1 Tax=unclassified Mycolicibacterium TaxID=2636767 RepID=UPI00238D28BA|nr:MULTISPECIES: Asp23/Gls24 family envelope stress response protein [unclassified Mycolicibacterium]BDX35185.1 hypothetical protein TUM20985_57320 [Mycolicibacterium sp. TUM20985]GLP78394.1 hypothetical protein TUM20983_55040 [Mycolicibacterium sp. TUM20983]GLP81447.1 hypothetical protein TUM20984_28670 [Mycolicibacterium sp. TUM20984]
MVDPALHPAASRPTSPGGGGDDGGDRGGLVIRDKVAQRVAEKAARDTAGVQSHAAGLDKLTGRELPRAKVYLSVTRVRAHLDIAVAWPHPLPEVGAAVQRNVTDALTNAIGLVVDGVDVAIEAVVGPTPDATRTLL